MYGRFTLGQHQTQDLLDHYALSVDQPFDLSASYNIPPTQSIITIVNPAVTTLELKHMRWGLLPSCSRAINNRYNVINARAESIAAKPSYTTPFRQQRCLIVADGFYEWHNDAGSKQA